MTAGQIVTSERRLRQISRPTTASEVAHLDLINRLRTACGTAWTHGCGLAAIQIGVPLRFAWYRWGEREYVLLNPEITARIVKNKLRTEACLSIPDQWVKVRRYYKIKYITDGQRKTARGLRAQIIQHEIDHMNGVLITDPRREAQNEH